MLKKTPLILVTNDDGITSPGIAALIEAMQELGNVAVVAPDKPQSGVGHSITINSILRIQKVKLQGIKNAYSTSGTPVDCVKLALYKILKQKPDVCVSGINHGSNISLNVIYSGTMSAAIEGAIEGIPSVGFSLMDASIGADFSASKSIVKIITANLLRNGLPSGVCLNVNIPPLHISQLKGIKICKQAKANWKEKFEERKDTSGKPYFWLTGEFMNFDKTKKDTDIWAVQNNFVSVVPVQFDLTEYRVIPELKQWKLTL
ncbi:MAG: 5'/3'-nucleotidase SurE [Bacteroidota bacterium]